MSAVDDDASFVALLVRHAAAAALEHVDLEGAACEFAVVWWPKGRAVTKVNMVQAEDVSLDRTHEALEVAVAQIEASNLA